MPRYHRWRQPGGWYFFTVVTMDRRNLLLLPEARAALRVAWRKTQAERSFDVFAVVLLPEHLHCIWRLPEGDDDYPTRWRLIKARTTAALALPSPKVCTSRARRNEGSLWQRRYWEHVLRDEADLKRHVDYVHYNPVKHGLASRAWDWPYSTFPRFVAIGEYDKTWGQGEPESLKSWPGPPE